MFDTCASSRLRGARRGGARPHFAWDDDVSAAAYIKYHLIVLDAIILQQILHYPRPLLRMLREYLFNRHVTQAMSNVTWEPAAKTWKVS